MKIKNRLKHYILFSIIVASTIAATLSPVVSAQTSVSTMVPTDIATSWIYYNALSACIASGGLISGNKDAISTADAKIGKWFYDKPVDATNPTIGYFLTGTGLKNDGVGRVGCGGDNTDWIAAAAKLWGYSDGIDLLCDTGAVRQNQSDCRDGSGDFTGDPSITSRNVLLGGVSNVTQSLSLTKFKANVGGRIYGGPTPSLTDPSQYILYQRSLFAGCLGSAQPNAYTGPANDNWVYTLTYVDPNAVTSSTVRYYGTKPKTDSIDYAVNADLSTAHMTCGSMALKVNSYANVYFQYLKANPTSAGKEATASTEATAAPVTTTGTSSCAIDGIGWIVCPVMTFLGAVSDNAYSFIANNFLNINVKLLSPTLTDGTANPTFSTWGTFRNIANVLFVIVFLIIVFSQLTSVGISSYGVKKMLPRLVIAAILVNASYYIVQIAVDLSNILGYSLKALFDSLPVYTSSGTAGTLQKGGEVLTWGVLLVGVLGATVGIALAISAPVLLAALLSALMTVLILIGRQAVIVILVIISPLAFVAWLLPNTEQWFKKWWKMFFSLLMVFPVIGVLYGASKMAATVMQAVGASSGDTLLSVVALGVATIPLILTPTLLKGSLKATGALGAKLNGLSSKANSRLGGKVKDTSRLGEFNKNRQIKSLQNRADRRVKLGGLQNKIDSSRLGRRLGFDKGAARAVNIVASAENEEVEASEKLMRANTDPRELLSHASIQLAEASKSGDVVKARAATKILLSGGDKGLETLHTTLKTAEAGGEATLKGNVSKNLRADINSAGLKTKDNVLSTWAFSEKATIAGQEADRSTFSNLSAAALVGQSEKMLQAAIDAGAVSSTQALDALTNQNSAQLLTPDKKVLLQRVVDAAVPPTTPPGGTTTPPGDDFQI